ncbi:integrase [Methanoculleus sp. FWC-SCC1]|uniref:Integrase n=1 Tax=Methanoculleus frigidifontis TaxID=2584085 RepID=A0ABT8M6U7_9EURY|nr:tyrosine-type recombinase/integrase [Methanoculleus sp. FWC-SCC1]MDN7023614.1 integrase [Methanoculleus sp. FWC-SCC1]
MQKPRFDSSTIPVLDPPENTEILKKYVRHCELRRVAPTTITNKVRRLAPFLKWAGVKADEVPAEAIEDYFLDRMDRLSSATIDGDVIEFRVFYKWLIGTDRAKELLKNIKKSRKKRDLPVEQLLTREDIQALIACAERQRDRALIALLWDSGARITGVLDLNVGHISFDRYGGVCIVEDKTGKRKLRLISSVPDLQTWLDQHPFGTDAQAPLFVTSRSFTGGKPRRLAGRTVNNLLSRLGKQAGIQKPTNPHAIRHARLTDLAREGLSEMELRIVAGWSKSSNMPEVYVHLSGADVEKKILKAEGVIVEEEEKRPTAMQAIKCPRCKELNAAGSRRCKSCSLILDPKLAVEVDEKSQYIPEVLAVMMKKPNFHQIFEEAMLEVSLQGKD